MTARILQFPNWAKPTDDDLAILLRASVIWAKSSRYNVPERGILIQVRG